jgi:GntR family transcriptional regulator/MocR family aminotransferase
MAPEMLLDLDGHGPRYAQITRALQQSIRDGILQPGGRLPSHRQLAAELGCARNLVVLAYEQLMLEGYLISRPKAGTFVSPELPSVPLVDGRARRATMPGKERRFGNEHRRVAAARQARSITAHIGRSAVDFAYGICEPDPRVIRQLRAGFSTALRKGMIGYGDPSGDFRLRQHIVERLRGTRGIVCSPSQVVVTNGTQQALDVCARLFLKPGDRAVVEDPGYEAARAAFATAGATVVPVAIDDEGLDPATLHRGTGVRVIYVTPSHQFPTGAILSAPRRHALLTWARSMRAVIIEDDYDGELRYQGQPLKALAALDPQADVIYCGTFSKSLFPALRLGYMVLPASLAEAAIDAKWLADRGSSILLQHLLRDLMASGEYDRHLRRMKRRYLLRRDVLIRALTRHFGANVEISGAASGLHLVAWLPRLPVKHLDTLVAMCATRDIGVYSLARHAVRRLPRCGLMLGYGLIEPDAIERGVRELADEYGRLVSQGRRGRNGAVRGNV